VACSAAVYFQDLAVPADMQSAKDAPWAEME
jgi:hypothetical protein